MSPHLVFVGKPRLLTFRLFFVSNWHFPGSADSDHKHFFKKTEKPFLKRVEKAFPWEGRKAISSGGGKDVFLKIAEKPVIRIVEKRFLRSLENPFPWKKRKVISSVELKNHFLWSQGWKFALWFFEQIACFLWVKERFALEKLQMLPILKSDGSNSFTVTLLLKSNASNSLLDIKRGKTVRHIQKVCVAEPKLFFFGSGSDFGHNFGSGSSYSHILALTVELF